MIQRLSPRLATIASLVPAGQPMADIGTDHGRLPARLLASGRVPRAIGSDRRAGPLAVARMSMERAGVAMDLRRGEGLSVLAAGEVACVVVAGMGGATIRRILERTSPASLGIRRLILQPNSDWPRMRRFIVDQKWSLIDERIVEDGGRFYLVLVVDPQRRSSSQLTRADELIGPILRRTKTPELHAWLAREIDRLRHIAGCTHLARRSKERRGLAAHLQLAILEQEAKSTCATKPLGPSDWRST